MFGYSEDMHSLSLPATSPEHYLTGQAALNVPSDDGDFADWHFTEVFLSGRGRFVVAGENFIDTTPLLGTYGIRECADVLREHGLQIPEHEKVYAANHVRAVLDLVLSALEKGQVPSHITVDDTLDSEASRRDLSEQIERLKMRMTDRTALTLFEQWEKQQ